MLNLTDDRADSCPEPCMHGVLARFGGVHNFSFSVDKTKWVVIDSSKHCTNHSPMTLEGTAVEPPSNFQQRQIPNPLYLFWKTIFQGRISYRF